MNYSHHPQDLFGLPWWVAQMVKNLPAMQETQIQSLSQEDPMEKDIVTHCSILGTQLKQLRG